MSYESDYRYRPSSGGRADPGNRQHPMDLPTTQGSGKGLLFAAVAIIALIAVLAVMSVGDAPEGVAPAADSGAAQSTPGDGTTGDATITPTPSQGE